ncbi:MAG: hypothetical protein R3344_03740 [Acidobacteriota bacterium]|nr:hypothetical protein [Acidobacteriota bacterium]
MSEETALAPYGVEFEWPEHETWGWWKRELRKAYHPRDPVAVWFAWIERRSRYSDGVSVHRVAVEKWLRKAIAETA